jgi:hypothetical protein
MSCACDAHAGQRRDIGAPTRGSLFAYHGPGAQRPSCVNPACLRMLPSVPGATSWLGLPATVTPPGLVGCRYWRWLPRWATWRQVPRRVLGTSYGGTLSVRCALAPWPSEAISDQMQTALVVDHVGESGGRRRFRTSGKFEYEWLRSTISTCTNPDRRTSPVPGSGCTSTVHWMVAALMRSGAAEFPQACVGDDRVRPLRRSDFEGSTKTVRWFQSSGPAAGQCRR